MRVSEAEFFVPVLMLSPYLPDFLARLGEVTRPDGAVEQIGHILVKWVSEPWLVLIPPPASCGRLAPEDS